MGRDRSVHLPLPYAGRASWNASKAARAGAGHFSGKPNGTSHSSSAPAALSTPEGRSICLILRESVKSIVFPLRPPSVAVNGDGGASGAERPGSEVSSARLARAGRSRSCGISSISELLAIDSLWVTCGTVLLVWLSQLLPVPPGGISARSSPARSHQALLGEGDGYARGYRR